MLSVSLRRAAALGVCVCTLGTVPLIAQDNGDGDWLTIETEGICATGTPYQFFVHEGDPSKLAVYFQGGGACWNQATCSPTSPLLSYDLDVGTFAQEFGEYSGIFDLENPANPIADYTLVAVPYCTGDIFTGDTTVEYGDFEIHHVGARNARLVLDWVYANNPPDAVERVFVSGSSAGAYGAAYHGVDVFANYPLADHALLGDAGVGVTSPRSGAEQMWRIGDNLSPLIDRSLIDDVNLTDQLYLQTAALFPQARLTQFTNHADSVQVNFFRFLGGRANNWWQHALNSLTLLDEQPNFSMYIAPGDDHVILVRPEAFDLRVNDVDFMDWLSALVNGVQPDSVIALP
jgi:hypothetical protein